MDLENMVYIDTQWTHKKNEIMFFAGKWMELENIILSEVSQVQKDKSHIFSLINGRQIQKINIYTKTNMITYAFIYRTCL
jgi:hypothetical protein